MKPATVIITDNAVRDLKKIPKNQQKKIIKHIDVLENNPRAGKKLSGEFEGDYSLKAWPYRIIYLIKKNGEVWVTHILHRQAAYK